MSVSASRGGVRLLSGCAAINMTLAALGWFWQGGYVASALLDKVARSGTLTLGSWNWNAVHIVLWALWISGWFALLAARFHVAKLNGPPLHRLAMTIAAAGTAASLFWLGALIDVGNHLWALDSGRLLPSGVSAGLVRWTAAPLAVGAAVAIFYFVTMLRWRLEAGDVHSAPGQAGNVSPPSSTEPASSAVQATDAPSSDAADAALPSRTVARSTAKRPAEPGNALRTWQVGMAALSLAGFGLFWQFIAFGPAETTWSLDRLFSGPAAAGWAALCFLALAHVAHVASGALTVFDRPDVGAALTKASEERNDAASESSAGDP